MGRDGRIPVATSHLGLVCLRFAQLRLNQMIPEVPLTWDLGMLWFFYFGFPSFPREWLSCRDFLRLSGPSSSHPGFTGRKQVQFNDCLCTRGKSGAFQRKQSPVLFFEGRPWCVLPPQSVLLGVPHPPPAAQWNSGWQSRQRNGPFHKFSLKCCFHKGPKSHPKLLLLQRFFSQSKHPQ